MTEPLIFLPHTGLRVPHTRLRVSSLKTLPTPDGEAFTATLRLDGRVVGYIHNDGNGGATTWTTAGTGFSWRDLDAYVAACTTDAGTGTGTGTDTVEEHILDDLVEEYATARAVAKADRAGQTALRLCQAINGVTFTAGEARATRVTTPAHRQRLIANLAARSSAGDDDWWQLWNGTAWEDLTHRPDPPADKAVTG